MLDGCTYTGRPSSEREKRGVLSKFRSVWLGKFTLYAAAPSMDHISQSRDVVQRRLPRQLRCASYPRFTSVTAGAVSRSPAAGAPPTQSVGMLPLDVRYEFQSGVGIALPTQEIWRNPFGRPVLTLAPDSKLTGIMFRNSPMPPLSTPTGGDKNWPTWLKNMPVPRGFFAYIQVNPTRGLTAAVPGA